MKYFGLQSQIRRNNANSTLLLLMFPVVFVGLTWLFFFFLGIWQSHQVTPEHPDNYNFIADVNYGFLHTIPWILIGVLVWFVVAWFSHTNMIEKATSSKPLERKENLKNIEL